MLNIGKVELKLNNEIFDIDVKSSNYHSNNELAILLYEQEVFPFAKLSVNIPQWNGLLENKNQFFVKTWAENEPIVNQLRNSNLFINTGRKYKLNYSEVEVWELANMEKLK